MTKKHYDWGGLKMPIFDLSDPDYCEYGCPICRAARAGSSAANLAQKVELLITFGRGCPWGIARYRTYGVRPNEPLPEETESEKLN